MDGKVGYKYPSNDEKTTNENENYTKTNNESEQKWGRKVVKYRIPLLNGFYLKGKISLLGRRRKRRENNYKSITLSK